MMTKIFDEMHLHYHQGLFGSPSTVDNKSPQGQFWKLGSKHHNDLKKLDDECELNGKPSDFSFMFECLSIKHNNEYTGLMNKVRRRMKRASQYGGRRHNRS